ncbi:MAG: hypothetical protein GY874_21145 [Desulfobacteraceae bacterium]|nr:hypothetical protein [Desulfobacteraceae bacterium]
MEGEFKKMLKKAGKGKMGLDLYPHRRSDYGPPIRQRPYLISMAEVKTKPFLSNTASDCYTIYFAAAAFAISASIFSIFKISSSQPETLCLFC